jgi:histidine triad (HIT) family protein
VLTIPNEHFENIYDLPLSISAKIQKTCKAIALMMKEIYSCDGVMLVQRKVPAARQQAWQYHLHVIPRYKNDNWHLKKRGPLPIDERAAFARQLSAKLDNLDFE